MSSPPRKRPRALLMSPSEGEVPPENTFQWKGKKAFDGDAADKLPEGESHDEAGVESHEGADDGGQTYEPSEADTEDEFSKMVSFGPRAETHDSCAKNWRKMREDE